MFEDRDSNFYEKGVSLVEIIVAIFIIAMFSAILISDFPRILRQFALSRASYTLAQDLRKAEDLGLSGVQIEDDGRNKIQAKGYGVYINLVNNTQYIIYADRGELPDSQYDGTEQFCSNESSDFDKDCILEIVQLSLENKSLYIKDIKNISGQSVSINFTPPGPTVEITGRLAGSIKIGIVLGLMTDKNKDRTIWVNTAGLVEVN